MEVLYIPWVVQWFSILRSQEDTSRATYLGHTKGPSQMGESLLAPSLVSTRRSTRSSTWSSLLHTNRSWHRLSA
jgi:hypothetical protein